MSGYFLGYGEPCDGECMRANGCHGFVECEDCGQRFCVHDLDERGLCTKCAEKADERLAAEEAEFEEAVGGVTECRREVLASLAAHLTEARGLAKRAAMDVSFVSEIDHALKVALFNLEEERGTERGNPERKTVGMQKS